MSFEGKLTDNGYINITLEDTAELMKSDNYKERFEAEYYQLRIRHDKLLEMVCRAKREELAFKPSCPIRILEYQLQKMSEYLEILSCRAEIEGIRLYRVKVI